MLTLFRGESVIKAFVVLFSVIVLTVSAGANTVREIAVRSLDDAPVDASSVMAYTKIKVGDPFDRALVSGDVRRLVDTKRFSYVSVDLEPVEPDGVRITYLVRPKLLLVEKVEVAGNSRFFSYRIRRWTDLKEHTFFDRQMLETAGGKIRREYRDNYYPDAEVTWKIDTIDITNRLAKVTVLIDEGKKIKVKHAEFIGNTVFTAKQLRSVVGLRPWWHPMRYFSPTRFGPAKLADDVAAIRGLYLDHGYINAVVADARVEVEGEDSPCAKYDIKEGPRFIVGKSSITGVRKFPLESVRESIKLKSGDIARRDRIGEDLRRIREYYGSRGYYGTYVRLVKDVVSDAPPTVDISYEVTEGELTFVRNVRVRGNLRTRDRVIRREILVNPGDLYNEVKVSRTEKRLMNMGYFASVKTFGLPTGLEGQRDLVYEVEEKSTGNFMMGAGYSNIDKLTGFVELSQGNFDLFNWPYFTGGGQKVKLRTQISSNKRDYEINFVEPWFFSRRLRLGVDLYNREKEYDDYELMRTGFSIGLTRSLDVPRLPFLSGRLGLRYSLERSKVKDYDMEDPYIYADYPHEIYDFAEDEGTWTTSALELKWTRDRRNHPFSPSSGYRLIAFGSMAGGPLGADTDIYRLGMRARYYVPLWFNHVLSLRARFEVVDAYGGTDKVPINDRLFLGGGRTLRGYEYRDVGPKVIPSDETLETATDFRSIGGNSLAMWSAEYTIPLNRVIRFAAFYDEGNVAKDAYEFDFAETASSAGIGLRLDMPGFPIRLDYAWALEADDELSGEERFSVWIGID